MRAHGHPCRIPPADSPVYRNPIATIVPAMVTRSCWRKCTRLWLTACRSSRVMPRNERSYQSRTGPSVIAAAPVPATSMPRPTSAPQHQAGHLRGLRGRSRTGGGAVVGVVASATRWNQPGPASSRSAGDARTVVPRSASRAVAAAVEGSCRTTSCGSGGPTRTTLAPSGGRARRASSARCGGTTAPTPGTGGWPKTPVTRRLPPGRPVRTARACSAAWRDRRSPRSAAAGPLRGW